MQICGKFAWKYKGLLMRPEKDEAEVKAEARKCEAEAEAEATVFTLSWYHKTDISERLVPLQV